MCHVCHQPAATSLQSALKTFFDAAQAGLTQAQLQAVCTSNDNQAAFLIFKFSFRISCRILSKLSVIESREIKVLRQRIITLIVFVILFGV